MSLGRRDIARGGALAAAFVGLGAGRARAGGSTVPGVVVYCDPQLRSAITAVGRLFAEQTGTPARVFCAAPWMMLAQIDHATQNDILITLATAMDDAARRRLIKPETRFPLGRNRLTLAARRGAVPPAGSDPAAIRSLIGNGPVALPDATSISTIDSARAMGRLGYTPPYPFHVVGSADGEDVAFLVANGTARLGLMYATGIGLEPRLVSAVMLPDDAPAAYAASISVITRSPNAMRFLDFLRTPQATSALRAAGLEDLS